jgi:hypothetical protein
MLWIPHANEAVTEGEKRLNLSCLRRQASRKRLPKCMLFMDSRFRENDKITVIL